MTDWIEFICAESLLDEPTEFICGCGGDIVQRIDEEDFFCWRRVKKLRDQFNSPPAGPPPPSQSARVWTSASARTVPAGCGSGDQEGGSMRF
jgi:hypothetical protein